MYKYLMDTKIQLHVKTMEIFAVFSRFYQTDPETINSPPIFFLALFDIESVVKKSGLIV